MLGRSLAAFSVAALLAPTAAAQGTTCAADGAPEYSFVPLASLGDRPFIATALNDAGQVAGRVTLESGDQAAFLWTADDLLLEPFGDAIVTVEDLTEGGLVLGTVRPSGQSVPDIFLWDSATGAVQIVPTPFPLVAQGVNSAGVIVGIDADSLFGLALDSNTGQLDVIAFGDVPKTGVGTMGARAINDAGVAVGAEVVFFDADGGSYFERPYRWTQAGGIEELPLLPGGLAGRAVDVSAGGDAAGTVFDEFFAFEPALWLAGEDEVLGLGYPGGLGSGDALALNDHGQVVVVASNDIFGFTRGFLWEAGAYTDLSCFAPPGLFVTRPLDINAGGDVLVQLTDDLGLQIVDTGVLVAEDGDVLPAEVVRLGTPPNPSAFLPSQTTPPVVGATWDPVLDHGTFVPAALLDVALIALAPDNLFLPGHGTLLCDLGTLVTTATATAPGAPFQIPVPLNPALAGFTFSAQGASANSMGVQLANALDVTIGS